MHFDLEQRFDANLADVVDLYCDPSFHESLTGLTKVSTPKAISCERTDDQVVLELGYRFIDHLSGAVTAVVDRDKLTWREITTFDLAAATSTTRFAPDNYADRLSCTISCAYVSDDAGTIRRITGDIKVKMLLVGGQVERAIVSGISEHLTEEWRAAVKRLTP